MQTQRMEPIIFNASPEPTIGVEMEIWLVDPETRQLVSRAEDLINCFPDSIWIKKELWQGMVEVNTGVCKNVREVHDDLSGKLARVREATRKMGIGLVSSGTHPLSDWRTQDISRDPRYHRLLDLHRWPATRLLISGLHVHVGVNSGEKAIAVVNSLCSYLPHMLALSASSPFWHGRDTGLSSSRAKIFEGLPKAGLPHFLVNWAEFVRLMRTLLNSRTIENIRDIWWDIRPHPGFGTIEMRICDAMPTLQENMALVAFTQALVVHLCELYDAGEQLPVLRNWTQIENKWRATRHGNDAIFIRNELGDLVPIVDHLWETVEMIGPVVERLGSTKEIEFLKTMVEVGNSCDRQRRVYEQFQDVNAVVDSLIWEFENDTLLRPGEERSFLA